MCTLVTTRGIATALWSTVVVIVSATQLFAQEGPLRPGEAFVTRFSGIQQTGPQDNPVVTIDVNGTVGSILDIRSPRQPPRGEHWINEPQRSPIPAAAVGQVFGVALDDNNPPNIYLTSTSAFGLHHAGNQWMPGMWGPGGPGAIYKLTATNTGYRPSLFATVTLNGRPNSGPALGNIAYDKTNRQFFVSDLETGMIHRVGLDGSDRGFFDHGVQGRPNFLDASNGRQGQLPPIPFDPNSRARFADCPAQPADASPECWNLAANGRRIWGLGVRAESGGRVRLYYSVWSSPAYDPDGWRRMSEEDKRNTVWSVGIGPEGGFMQDVRREFVVPDFFVEADDVSRSGYSSPVSDISFPVCSARPVMLIAERGGIRNLGLAAENAFANPHESRTIRLELDTSGAWRPVGRYDIGFYDRQKDGLPFLHANCAGGAAFGPGYSPQGEADFGQPDQFVWISGDSLCSPDGPCNLAGGLAQQAGAPGVQQASGQTEGDDSEVHGIQGTSEANIAELAPAAAYQQNPNDPNATAAPRAPNESYLIDTDVNVDMGGNPIESELLRNDATLIGDIAIYQLCQVAAAQESFALLPAPPPTVVDEPPIWVGHPSEISHAQYSSHGRDLSHFRWGSHYPVMSHRRWQSHYSYWSHNWRMSGWHNTYWSHWPRLSHRRWGSDQHWRWLSPPHHTYLSPKHMSHLSLRHERYLSPYHVKPLSPGHWRHISPGHRLPLSPYHNPQISTGHKLPLSPYHNHILSDKKHKLPLSPGQLHNPNISKGQHTHILSQRVPGIQPLHNRVLSASKTHNPQLSGGTTQPKHNQYLSKNQTHHPQASNAAKPHSPQLSNAVKPVHSPRVSNAQKQPIHNQQLSKGATTKPVHHPQVSNAQKHNAQVSNAQKKPVHNPQVSNAQKKPQHNQQVSKASSKPVHSAQVSNAQKKPVHSARVSNAQKKPVHNPQVSNAQKNKQTQQKHVQQQKQAQQQKQQVQKQQQQQKQQQKQQQQKQQQKKHIPQTSQYR